MSAESFAGRVALVAGGAQGIGLAIAHDLAARGARVVIADPGTGSAGIGADPASVRRAAVAIGATPFADSIASPSAAMAAVALAVTRFGGLDILINAAAIHRDGGALALDPGDVEAVIRTNLLAAVCMIAAAAPVLGDRAARRGGSPDGGGRIVSIAATAGRRGASGQAADAAARAGLVALTRAVACDLVPSAVTCNAVLPQADEGEAVDEALAAALVAGLCLPAAQSVTGQIIGLRGGEVVLFAAPRPAARLPRADAERAPAALAAALAAHALPLSSAFELDMAPPG